MEEHVHPYRVGRAVSQRLLLAAFSLTLAMFFVELFGGVLSNSLSLIGDSGHMLMDSLALIVGVLAIRMAQRPANAHKSYGYYRLEILAALANGVLLVIVSLYVFYEAYYRFTAPVVVRAPLMLVIAVVGLIVNLVSLYLLREVKDQNLNVKGAFTHVFSDAISSIGVIVAAVVIFFTQAFIVDALMGILIGGIILRSAFGLLSESSAILLESTPKGIEVEAVKREMGKVKGVKNVHDLHIWAISSGINAMSGHIVIDDQRVSKSKEVLEKIAEMLQKNFGITHTTIQIECKVCQGPFACTFNEENGK